MTSQNSSTYLASDLTSYKPDYSVDNLTDLTENDKKYLEYLQIDAYNKMFSEQLKAYDEMLKAQYNELHIQSDIAYNQQQDALAENNQGLGTGASAIYGNNLAQNKKETDTQIDESLAEARNEFIETQNKNYSNVISQLLGGMNSDGKYNALIEYNEMATLATDAAMQYMAEAIAGSILESNGGDIYEALVTAGYVEQDEFGNYSLTDIGYEYLDAMLNSTISLQKDESGKTVYDHIAEIMAENQYGDNWLDYDSNKQKEILDSYLDFFSLDNGGAAWRHTHLGMSGYDAEGSIVIDADYAVSDNDGSTSIDLNDNMVKYKLSDELQNEYNVSGDNVYGVVANIASIDDFPSFSGTGKNSKQDYLVNDILRAAKEGRIPDGTYINFNYGAQAAGHAKYWVYIDGKFYKTDYKIGISTNTLPDGNVVIGRVPGGHNTRGVDYIDPNDL